MHIWFRFDFDWIHTPPSMAYCSLAYRFRSLRRRHRRRWRCNHIKETPTIQFKTIQITMNENKRPITVPIHAVSIFIGNMPWTRLTAHTHTHSKRICPSHGCIHIDRFDGFRIKSIRNRHKWLHIIYLLHLNETDFRLEMKSKNQIKHCKMLKKRTHNRNIDQKIANNSFRKIKSMNK